MSNNFIVRDFGRKLLDSAPNNSVLMLHGDLASIPATFVPCNFSLDIVVIVISRKTQSVPPARKDTWLSVSFYCAIL